MTTRTFHLRFCDVIADESAGTVVTRFHADGVESVGTREASESNLKDAADLGYGDDVWRSLIDHEVLHSLYAEWTNGCESKVLRFCAGVADVPYYERIYEEAIVLALQCSLRTGKTLPALVREPALYSWRQRAREVLSY